MREAHYNGELTLIGYGSDKDKAIIDNVISKYGLEQYVHFKASDSDISEELSKNNVFVFPSTYEGLGIVLIEAQAMGLKCFASTTVPEEANLGNVTYLDLGLGHAIWSKEIIRYIEKNGVSRNYVSMNSGPLTTINSSNPMYITFPLESRDYAELNRIDGAPNVKREVEFTFSSGQKYEFKGTQDFYDNRVDESTGTITMRATFPNPKDVLLQGDFGKVKIYSNKDDNMPIVPQSATMENQEGLYVYIMDEENHPKLTYIKTMGQVGTNWVVYEGVKEGDTIITTGMQKVIPGSPVKVVSQAVQADNSQQKKPNIFTRIINKIKKLIAGNK